MAGPVESNLPQIPLGKCAGVHKENGPPGTGGPRTTVDGRDARGTTASIGIQAFSTRRRTNMRLVIDHT